MTNLIQALKVLLSDWEAGKIGNKGFKEMYMNILTIAWNGSGYARTNAKQEPRTPRSRKSRKHLDPGD